MYIVATKPIKGQKGVYRFLKGVKRVWFFWSKPVFTLDANEALRISDEDNAEGLTNWVSRKIDDKGYAMYLTKDELDKLYDHKFYALESIDDYDVAYYCGEEEMKIGHGVRQIPQFTGNILQAEFHKSRENAEVTINRLRQERGLRVRIREVYLPVQNEFTLNKVIIALQNKQTKRLRYLKCYDINGKSSDRLTFTDSMGKAWKTTIPYMMKVIEDIHIKHKVFLVFTHWYDGNDIPADQFRERKTGISMTFKFNV